MDLTTALLLLVVSMIGIHGRDDNLIGCYSRQQLELNHEDVILCQFPSDFFSVYWYENASREANPILTYKNHEKYGSGIDNGEYDIQPSGSLIITNVSFEHERVFKVVLLETPNIYHQFQVSCTIKVTSTQKHPNVDSCDEATHWCILESPVPDIINCSFAGTRPAAQIQWQRHIRHTLENLNTPTVVQKDSEFTFVARTSLTNYGLNYTLGHYVCNAKQQYQDNWMSQNVLINSLDNRPVANINWRKMYYIEGDRATLPCFLVNGHFLSAWRRIVEGEFRTVGYRMDNYTKIFHEYVNDFQITAEYALYTYAIQRSHEGKYSCTTTDGVSQEVGHQIHLIVIVPPTPSFLVLENCIEANCLLCSIEEIYPEVSLQWSSDDVHIRHIVSKTREENGLFSIQSKLIYDLKENCRDPVVTCSAQGEAARSFQSIGRTILKDQCASYPRTTLATATKQPSIVLIAILTPLSAAMITGAIIVIMYVRRRRTSASHENVDGEEMQELMEHNTNGSSRMRYQFLKELRAAYQEKLVNCSQTKLKKGIFHIPNDIVYHKSETSVFSDTPCQKQLNAYEELFTNDDLKISNIIIEAKAGHGKSTLAMKMMEHWTKQNEASPICEFDILVVIDLQLVKTGQTLIEMISSLLLPRDTTISAADVKTIIGDGTGCLIIFEDLDQYEGKHTINDVQDIINRKLLIGSKTIVFTRPTRSVTRLSKNVERFTLSHFTESQVHKYIKEYFGGSRPAEIFATKLQESAYLLTVCRCPQFLAITSSTYKNSDRLQINRDFSTTTDFFVELLESRDLDDEMLDEIIGKHAFDLSVRDKLSAFEVKSEYDDIVQKLSGIIFVQRDHSPPENKLTIQVAFQSRLFQQFFGARYLMRREDSEFDECLNRIEKILSCEELILFASGLKKHTAHLTKITGLLLGTKDVYPYPIRDILIYALGKANILKEPLSEEMKDSIRNLVQREYGLAIESSDPWTLQKIKAELISCCAKERIPIDTILLWNVIRRITEGTVDLKCGYSFDMPACVETYFISDMAGEITGDQFFYLLERTTRLEEVIMYSPKAPKYGSPEDFTRMSRKNLDVLVFWFTLSDRGDANSPIQDARAVVGFHYPSEKYRRWLSCEEATVIKTSTMRRKCLGMTEEEKVKTIAAKGVNGFIDSYASNPKAEKKRIRGHMTKKLQCMGRIIYQLSKVFDARTTEDAVIHAGLYQEELALLGTMLTNSLHLKNPLPTTANIVENEDVPSPSLRQLSLPMRNIYRAIRL